MIKLNKIALALALSAFAVAGTAYASGDGVDPSKLTGFALKKYQAAQARALSESTTPAPIKTPKTPTPPSGGSSGAPSGGSSGAPSGGSATPPSGLSGFALKKWQAEQAKASGLKVVAPTFVAPTINASDPVEVSDLKAKVLKFTQDVDAEKLAKENAERGLAAEKLAKENAERDLAAEKLAKENAERDLAAEKLVSADQKRLKEEQAALVADMNASMEAIGLPFTKKFYTRTVQAAVAYIVAEMNAIEGGKGDEWGLALTTDFLTDASSGTAEILKPILETTNPFHLAPKAATPPKVATPVWDATVWNPIANFATPAIDLTSEVAVSAQFHDDKGEVQAELARVNGLLTSQIDGKNIDEFVLENAAKDGGAAAMARFEEIDNYKALLAALEAKM